MKLFFYKSMLIFFLFLIAFHLSFSYLFKKLKTELANNFSKEKVLILKSKIKDEMNSAINKDVYIKPDDAKLINDFINKIKTDLNKGK